MSYPLPDMESKPVRPSPVAVAATVLMFVDVALLGWAVFLLVVA
jgi:hypothetical protein